MNTRPIHIKLVSGQPVIRHQRRFVCARFQAGHLNRLVNRRISSSKSPQENTGGESGEKEISIRDVLEEVSWSPTSQRSLLHMHDCTLQ